MAKFYTNRGLGTSVAEGSDREPGGDQRVDNRYLFTDGFDRLGKSVPFSGPSERDSTKRINAMRRRSAVRAASRYQWSQGGSAGKEFGRRQAAYVDKRMQPEQRETSVENIAQF